MEIQFTKFQGTGNDFVMIDNRNGDYDSISESIVQLLCNRKTGIGADGLIKINSKRGYDFEVDYFNADGSKSFCGNGARCSIAFANSIGVRGDKYNFWAIDGEHDGFIEGEQIHLAMNPVNEIVTVEGGHFIDTGSPHFIRERQTDDPDIVTYGRSVRYSEKYEKEGVNVNYLNRLSNNSIQVETYERGVEDETLSCGTGVTAVALLVMNNTPNLSQVHVETKGGVLRVEAERNGSGFDNIWLIGPAKKVFDGSVDVEL